MQFGAKAEQLELSSRHQEANHQKPCKELPSGWRLSRYWQSLYLCQEETGKQDNMTTFFLEALVPVLPNHFDLLSHYIAPAMQHARTASMQATCKPTKSQNFVWKLVLKDICHKSLQVHFWFPPPSVLVAV